MESRARHYAARLDPYILIVYGASRDWRWKSGDESRGSRFEVRGSRFEVRGSRFEVRGSRFEELDGLGGSDDQDAGDACGFAAGADFDDYVVFEGGGKVHEALDGEAFEFVALEGGDLGLVDAEDVGGLCLGEFASDEDFVDHDAEAEFGVEFLGVGQAEVGKDVARTDFCHHGFLRFRHVFLQISPGSLAQRLSDGLRSVAGPTLVF